MSIGDSLEDTARQANDAIAAMESWGIGEAIHFDPKKTDVMHFSRRKADHSQSRLDPAKRDVCWDRASKPIEETKPPKTPPKTPGKTPSKTPTKSRPVYKPSRFKVPKSAGNAAVFMLVAPYVHDALDAIKRWDNPIGRAVSWFDNAMASLQESIGGPQRTDIYGNELKYKMTKAIGSALQLGFETTWDKHELLAMNCNRNKLPKFGAKCTNGCRATVSLLLLARRI
ncbi:hypothetical protein ARSEF1564_009323 [Beauveria bassiana]